LKILIKKLTKEAKIPSRAYPDDAGIDLYALKEVVLEPGKLATIPTGIAVALPKGSVGLIWDKSGLASSFGLKTLGGVIDEGYRGEIKVLVINLGKEKVVIKKGSKIAQLLVQPILRPDIEVVEELPSSLRGERGFGSSGAS